MPSSLLFLLIFLFYNAIVRWKQFPTYVVTDLDLLGVKLGMSFTEIIIVVETTTSVEWMMVLFVFVFVFVFGKFGLSVAIVGGSLVLGATRHLVPKPIR